MATETQWNMCCDNNAIQHTMYLDEFWCKNNTQIIVINYIYDL